MATEQEPHRPPFPAAPSTPAGGAAQAARRRADRTVLIPSPSCPPDGGGIGDVPQAPDPTVFHPRCLPFRGADPVSMSSGVALFVVGVG